MQPTPEQAMQVVNPLQWQIGHGVAPDGTKVCVLQLNQGALSAALQVNAADMGKFGRAMVDAATQASTGLIIPVGVVSANGHQDG